MCGKTIPMDTAFPNGEGKEEAASPPKKEANPASLRSAAPSKGRGSRGLSLLPMEGGAPKGRIGLAPWACLSLVTSHQSLEATNP